MFNKYTAWMIASLSYALMINVSAQDLVNQPMQMHENAMQETYPADQELAPPPPGPYQVDPVPESASIYYDMQETVPYTDQPQPYSSPVAPGNPAAQMSDSYGQSYYPPPPPAAGGYYPQGGHGYGNAYPPTYPGYPPYSPSQNAYPYGPYQ